MYTKISQNPSTTRVQEDSWNQNLLSCQEYESNAYGPYPEPGGIGGSRLGVRRLLDPASPFWAEYRMRISNHHLMTVLRILGCFLQMST